MTDPAYTTWRLWPGWFALLHLPVLLLCLQRHVADVDLQRYRGLGVEGRSLHVYTCHRCRRIIEAH